MEQNCGQRVFYLDLLRVLATFGVIVIHVCGRGFYGCLFSPGWYYAVFFHSMVRWCVPIFFMISGTLFLNPQKTVTYKDVLQKYIPRILIAYVFWSIFYYFIDDYCGTLSIRKLFESSFHLWFLPVLMAVYLLIPLLRKLVLDKKLVSYLLIIWFVWSGITMLPALPTHFNFLASNDVFGYSGYFILGFSLSQAIVSTKESRIIYIWSVIGLFFTIVGTILVAKYTHEANEWMFRYLCPNVIVMAVGLFVLIKTKASKCGKPVLRFVDFVRKDLFGVYLVHVMWINILAPIIFQLGEGPAFKLVVSPVLAVMVFVLSLFTTKLIRLIPLLRKLVE
ncbi:MAG: acyltransferase family protein [Bacteroidales bacterium]|nr:acyltransferase family protein [Bacteroidales bacterium]